MESVLREKAYGLRQDITRVDSYIEENVRQGARWKVILHGYSSELREVEGAIALLSRIRLQKVFTTDPS